VEAIAEAAARPAMRLVTLRSEGNSICSAAPSTRD
jgi:hypothetical protein